MNGLLSGYGASTGLLATYPGDNSTVLLTGNPKSFTLMTPETLFMKLTVRSLVGLCESPNPIDTLVETDGMLSLPRTDPVFNLPEGYTCASVQLGIVDNYWVDPRVEITAQAEDASACVAGQAEFSVVAAGTAAYQWQMETPPAGSNVWNNLVDGPIGGSTASASGTTTDTLTITNTDPAAAVRYRCLLTNNCGTFASAPAALSVVEALPGDTNDDGQQDGLDVQGFLNELLAGPSGAPSPSRCASDLNQDGLVNDIDTQLLVSTLVGP
jgi:hypothetical protein